MAEIINLLADPDKKINPKALCSQLAARDDIEAVVIVARVDAKWYTCWGGDLVHGSLAIATLKLLKDTTDEYG